MLLQTEAIVMTDPKGRPQFADVYRRAREALADGAYLPGERVGVKDLATRLDTSTTPAREILSRLVGAGLVEEHRAEGYYLRRLDERQVGALYRLHALCVDAALRTVELQPHGPFVTAPDPWTLFDSIVEATGELVLGDVRRLLHARIALFQRCEPMLFDDLTSEARLLAERLLDRSRPVRRRAALDFHRRRIAQARRLAFLLSRR